MVTIATHGGSAVKCKTTSNGGAQISKGGHLMVDAINDGVEVKSLVSVSGPDDEVSCGEETPRDTVVPRPGEPVCAVEKSG